MRVYIKLSQEIPPISLYDANIGTETTAVIDRATAKPAEARTIYAKEYVNGNRYLAAASYDRAFNKYYEAGKKGMSFPDIKRSSRDIKADSARRIYEAGRRATENESKRQEQYKRTDEYKNRSKERTEQNTAAEKLGGVVREYSADKKISRSQRRQLKLFDVWAKKKGVVIRVVSSLAEKYKLEGKIINGEYAGGNTIVIALDGKNALTSTAGHEMYHMIENLSPEYAQSFREFVIDHLKAAGQYENVFKDYERRYGKAYARDEGFKAKIDEEIVADHCFEAMTNKEQWDSFAAENKTLAEKIKDFILEFVAMINRAYDKYFAHDNAEIRNEVLGEIDYMNEIANRLWEGVDKAVENYRFGAGTESETKFSINEIVDDDGNKYGIGVLLDSNLLEGLNQNERKQMVKEKVVNDFAGQQIIAYDKSGNAVCINFAENTDKIKTKSGKRRVLNELYRKNINSDIKQEAVVLADELIESAKYRTSIPSKHSHDWLDNNGKNIWDYWDVYIQDKNNAVYVATLNVANTQNGQKILYDIDPIKKVRGAVKSAPTLTNTNISQNDTDVNTHSMQNSKNNSSFSVSDADYLSAAESGDEKTAAEMVKKAAEEKFKDSVIRDDDGNLLKVYHGRVSKFNVFDRKFAAIESDLGKGFYFSSQEDDVDSNYANNEGPDLTNKIARLAERIESEQDIDYDEAEKKAREQYIKSEPNTVEAYLNVKNPAIISNDNDGTYLEYNENYDEETDDYGDPEGSLVDFVEALESAAEDYESFRPVNFWEALGESIYDGGISLKDAISLLKENIIDDLLDENGDLAINEVIRQAVEDIGFDGIIDKTVSEKFPNMQGMYSDTTHYIVFDSSQIKSADPITYDNDGNIIPLSERFNENEKDIRYQISENAEKDVQALLEGKKFTEDIKLTDSSPRIILGHKGVKNLPMLMKPSHILVNVLTTEEAKRRGLEIDPEKIHYHGLGKTRFLNIIRGLDNVNQAYRGTKNAADSSRRENYFLLISTLKDAEGNVINVPVYINEQGRYNQVSIDTNKIGTVFGREQLQRYIQKEIKNGNLVRIKKRSSLDSGLTGDKVPDRHNEATSRGGSEVSEKPTTKADDYYSIASDSSIYQSNEKSQEKFSQISKKFLTDETKTSISDAGMRLTDNAELSSLLREQAYKAEIERLKGELVKSKRMGGKGKNRLVKQDVSRIARDIISEYSSKIDFSTLRDELTGLYELMDNIEIQGSADYAELVKLSNDIAKSVIASSYVDITDQSAEKYKAAMRSYRLTPSLQDVAELEDMFGTFGAAYRQYGRKLNMRAQGTPGALHIDEVWEDLCDSVPFLDRDAESTQDMWRNLIEVRDSLDEKNGFNPYITDGDLTANEAAGALGADILERFNEVSPDTTFADRAQQRVDLRFPIVVMRIKIFSLTGCSDIINPSPNRTLSRNPLTARPTAHTLVLHDVKQCKQVYQRQCIMHKIVFVCKRCGLKARSGRTESHLQGILEWLGQNRQPLVSWQMILERRDRRLCPRL